MAKKSSDKKYTSKGERISSISTKNKDLGQRMLNQVRALSKGKNIVWSLPNEKDGKVLPSTKIEVNGKEHLKRLQNLKPSKADAE